MDAVLDVVVITYEQYGVSRYVAGPAKREKNVFESSFPIAKLLLMPK